MTNRKTYTINLNPQEKSPAKVVALPTAVSQYTVLAVSVVIPVANAQAARISAINSFSTCQVKYEPPSYLEYPIQYPHDYRYVTISAAILVFGLQVMILLMHTYQIKSSLLAQIGMVTLMFYAPTLARDTFQYATINVSVPIAGILTLLSMIIPVSILWYCEESSMYNIYLKNIKDSQSKLTRFAIILDMYVGTSAATLDGIRMIYPNLCRTFAVLMLILTSLFLLYLCKIKPSKNIFETYSSIARCSMQVLMCLLSIIITFIIDNTNISSAISLIGTISIFYLPIELIIIKIIEYRKKVPKVTTLTEEEYEML